MTLTPSGMQRRDRVLDVGFTDPARDAYGRGRVRLGGRRGHKGFPVAGLRTGDPLIPRAAAHRGVGIEPITCPPDAVRSDGVIALELDRPVSTAGDAAARTVATGRSTPSPNRLGRRCVTTIAPNHVGFIDTCRSATAEGST